MFEKEIQFITDFSLNTIKTLGSSFTMNSLFNIELHPAVIKYISGRLEYMIYEERKTLLDNSRFDYSGGKISKYFNLISEEIKKTKKLSFADVEDFVKKGVIFNANFSVRPKSTLTNLIFKDADAYKNTAEIKVYLNYLYYYDYYCEILDSYINKRKVVHLSKDEFRTVLDKIDTELLSSRKEEIISDALSSISDFYNIGSISKSSIQSPLVEVYLKEKNLDSMIEKFNIAVKDSKKKISIVELKKIIFSRAIEKVEAKPEVKEIEEESEEKFKSSNEIIQGMEFKEEKRFEKEIMESNLEENKTEDQKEKKEFIEEKVSTEEKESIEEKESDITIKPENDKSEEKELLQIDDESEESIFEEEILDNFDLEDDTEIEELVEENNISGKIINREKDLFSFLTQKEIDKIISSIFNDDEDDFANTLEKVSESRDYDQAAEILESVFYTYKVNPYKREAVALTNAVSNYFSQE